MSHFPDAKPLTAASCGPLRGRARPPGDKSISHRAFLLGLLSVGETRVEGLLEGEDVLHTGRACSALGAKIERLGEGRWSILGAGLGSLLEPRETLDFGNAGTGSRLMMGVVGGHGVTARFDGDASLRKRPMRRILDPLVLMGAQVLEQGEGGRCPILLQGTPEPAPIEYRTPVASAQIKSAVLLAGLNALGRTTVIESEASRDHTEKMLRYFGAELRSEPFGEHGRKIMLEGRPELVPRPIVVPVDPSSAAFLIAAALLVKGSDIVVEGVMMNPLRIGFLTTLLEMGAQIDILDQREEGGEDVADLARARQRSVGRECSRRPRAGDDRRISDPRRGRVFCARRYAHEWLAGTAGKGIRPAGGDRRRPARQRRQGDGGGRRPDRRGQRGRGFRRRSGRNPSRPPPRHELSGHGSGLAKAGDGGRRNHDRHLLSDFPAVDGATRRAIRMKMIIAIDGPAASGKGTLARRLAAHYGLPHLDTGLLYRATARLLLDEGSRLDDVEAAVRSARGLALT